jgi:hypothetical protein
LRSWRISSVSVKAGKRLFAGEAKAASVWRGLGLPLSC